MNPSDVEIPLDDKKQSFLPKKQPFFPVLQSPSVAPSPPLSSSRKHFTCWDALYELIIIPFRFSQELQGPPTTINPGSGPDPTTMSSHVILDKVAVPTYASLGARSYFTLFIMWLMTCLCLDITQYYSTCAETDLISFFATLPTNPEDINIKTNLENTLKLVDVIEKNQKFNLLGSRTLRLSMLLALIHGAKKFLEYGFRIYTVELLSLYMQHRFLCQDGLNLGSERAYIKVNELIVKSLPTYTENLMEILPLILFMPIRFFPYVLAALIRLQWVALAILVLFFASYFICTLFVDKQSRMQLSLSRLEPLFTALLQYVLSKWEEIEMSDAKGWFLESLIGRIERICRRIRVKSFYEALSKTVQYIARESIPIVTSWLVYRYTLLHYNGHASGDYLNMATKASENTFLSSLVDNRKALKFMGDGCQEIVDNYIFFETLYSNVKSLRPLLSLTESHPFRSRRHFPFDKHKNHVSLAEGELLFSKEVLIDFKEVHVDAPRKSVDEIPHCILKDISFQILSGENWLITGPSGIGKTTIFRALLKLWYVRKGQVYFKFSEAPQNYLKLSMVPVLIPGNLREQLTYPRPMAEYPESIDTLDANLQSILASLHLDHLISIFPLNESFPMTTWNTLSNGEKQRLQFARLFLWQPILAFLEESTLGIDPTLEKFIYLECRRRKIQLVAVDNRTEALREYFDKRLHFDKDRSYIITNL